MKKYLLNVTFYAGSYSAEDTDRDMFLLCVDRQITELEMKDIFEKVNALLDASDDNVEILDFPISYDQGFNINTLLAGVEFFTNGKIMELYSNCGSTECIDNYYVIEQSQS